MPKYLIAFEPSATRQLKKLDKTLVVRITKAIYKLADNPRPDGCKKMVFDAYRIRVGSYRIVYEIQDNIVTVGIIAVGHRREVYKPLRSN